MLRKFLKLFEVEKEYKSFLDLYEKYNLIEKGDRIIVGFSGGPDSVFLVEMLKKLKKYIEFDIFLVHINHLLRDKSSDEDEKFSKEYALKNNLEFFSKRIDIKKLSLERKKTLEEVGREERYNFFNEVLKEVNANKIATAHNKDDQIETFLFKLIRGTSLQGLEGIKVKNENIIRPISEIYKKDILNYLNKNEIQYRIDETNFENEFTRNSIRLDLIPFIEKRYNSKFKDKAFSLIKEIRENNQNSKIILEDYMQNEKIILEKLNKESLFNISKIISSYLNRYNINISREKIKKVKEILNKNGTKKIDLSLDFKIIKDYEFLYLQRNSNNIEREKLEEIDLKVPSKIKFGNYKISVENLEDSFEKIKENFIENKYLNNRFTYILEAPIGSIIKVRSRKDGDKIKLLGNTGTKKIKKIFIDKKISKDRRDSIPIFTVNEEIFWLAGVKKGDYLFDNKLKVKTQKILFSIEEVKVER